MKARTWTVAIALCCALSNIALSQSSNARPLRADAPQTSYAENADVGNRYSSNASLDAMVPRDGLQFYFEVRNGGLAELARAGGALEPLTKMIGAEKGALSANEIAGFAMKNLSAFSTAKFALAGYGASGVAAIIETATPAEAERLKADLTRMLAASPPAKKDASGPQAMSVSLRDRVVLVGASATIAKLAGNGRTFTLADDKQFLKARARFSDDPFFAFLEWNNFLPLSGGDPSMPYVPGMAAALSGLPDQLALGGKIQGDRFDIRALVLNNSKKGDNLFFSILSATQTGQSQAAGFASPDVELFLGAMIDWAKLYEAIESLIGMFAGAMTTEGGNALPPSQAGAMQSGDLLAFMEAELGFSIKHDLIPTLGNELAITFSGLDAFLPRAGAKVPTRTQKAAVSSVRFMLMLAVRDPVKFEGFMSRLLNPSKGRPSQPFARALYRGATIKYRKDMAYTITEGFLLMGGSRTEIQRAIDARATGASLTATAQYRSAMGSPRPAALQVYLSSGMTNKFYEMALADLLKTSRIPQSLMGGRSALGLTVSPDEEGMMVEVRAPTSLALVMLASMMNSKPSPYEMGGGMGSGAGDTTRPRSKTPVMTDDDLRRRRP